MITRTLKMKWKILGIEKTHKTKSRGIHYRVPNYDNINQTIVVTILYELSQPRQY